MSEDLVLGNKTKKRIKFSKILRKYGTVFAWLIICLIFGISAPETFPTARNFLTVLRQISMLAILSGGLTFVFIIGRNDLSIGYSTSFLGILVAALMKHFGMSLWIAIPATLIAGCIIGLINGGLVAYVGIPDFIGTLAVGYLLYGFNQAYTKGHPISSLPRAFDYFGSKFFLGIPSSVFYLAIISLFFFVLLYYTKIGRYLYAIGGNEEATMMSGVNVKRYIMTAYVFCGFAAALTAIILTSRLGSAHPQAGESYLLDCIAAVYLGSTVFKNGEPNLAGSILGAVIIGTMSNGLTILSIPYYYHYIATGLIILGAVITTSIQKMKKK